MNRFYLIALVIVLFFASVYLGIFIRTYREFGWDYCLSETDRHTNETEIHCFPTSSDRQQWISSQRNVEYNLGNNYLNDLNFSDVYVGNTTGD